MTVTTRSDAELLGRVRQGDDGALAELYVRHRASGVRLARSYGAGADAEDLVNEAFERVMAALRRGRGPVDSFRPYLFVTIRRLASDRDGGDHGSLEEVPEVVVATASEPDVDLTDRALVAEAFADLPDRWQTVLWHTAVEGRRPREVARAVGMPANTVAVLAHRARERLRQRYLQAHLLATCPAVCAPHRARLGAHVRGGLTRRHGGAVDAHLAECADCRRLADELGDVNRLLARAVLPAFALAGQAGPDGGAVAAAGGSAFGGATGAGGSTLAGGGTAGGAALGVVGGAAGVAKVAAAIAALVGLVAVSPVDVGGGADRPTIEAGGPVATERSSSAAPATDPTSTTPPSPTGTAPAPPASPSAGTGRAAAGEPLLELGVGLDSGVGLDVTVAPLPGVGVDAQAGVGLAEGVELRAAWRAAALGTGTLAVDVANAASDALVGADLVVDLSPGARPTSLVGTCHATDPGLVGAVLSLLGSLTCDLAAIGPSDGATLSLPLAVLGAGQTASVRVIAGGVELAATTVDLAG